MTTPNNDKENNTETASRPADASEEAVQRSMKPLESRTALPGNNERRKGYPESAQQVNRDDKEDETGEGFIDITNDAGEIE